MQSLACINSVKQRSAHCMHNQILLAVYWVKRRVKICLYQFQLYEKWNSARLILYEYTESEILLFCVDGEWNSADVHEYKGIETLPICEWICEYTQGAYIVCVCGEWDFVIIYCNEYTKSEKLHSAYIESSLQRTSEPTPRT
jgi:hypothetical protein